MDVPKSPEKVTLTDVQSFVQGNIVTSRKEEIRCGDGRATQEQSKGAIRAFGEDYGIMLAIKGALGEQGVDDAKLVDSYLKAVKPERGENPKLFIHTDTHAQESGGIGCGHAKLSQGNEGGYIVEGNEAASLYQAILERPEVDIQVMEGDHNENGVLLIYSEKDQDGKRFSVNSMDTDRKSSYFVVDMEGIKDHFNTIVPKISEDLGLELSSDDAMSAYEKQQGESAQRLAFSKGIPPFRVNIDSFGTASVEKLGA